MEKYEQYILLRCLWACHRNCYRGTSSHSPSCARRARSWSLNSWESDLGQKIPCGFVPANCASVKRPLEAATKWVDSVTRWLDYSYNI